MTTSSLAIIKKKFGIDDKVALNYEKKDNELILHVPLQSRYHSNNEIIAQARDLAQQRKERGWTRQDFFADFKKVRDEVLQQIRAHYEQD